jgi:hypothetical protein
LVGAHALGEAAAALEAAGRSGHWEDVPPLAVGLHAAVAALRAHDAAAAAHRPDRGNA